jgi:hypothetical protein
MYRFEKKKSLLKFPHPALMLIPSFLRAVQSEKLGKCVKAELFPTQYFTL